MRVSVIARLLMLTVGSCVSHAFILPAAVTRPTGVASSRHSSVAVVRGPQQRNAAVLPLQQSTDAAEDARPGSLVLIEVTKKHARVFKSVAKGTEAEIVEPVDEWRIHEQSNKEKRSQGQGKHHAEKTDPVTSSSYLVKFYMDELSDVINAADSVLLVGHGSAKSNLAEGLATALYERQPELTEKIADVLRVDSKHTTENQLLQLGRRHLLHADDPRKDT